MKVQSSDVDIEETAEVRISKYTLKFLEQPLEEKFNEMIMTGLSNILGINRKDNLAVFILSYSIVVLIYLISYIVSFIKVDSNRFSLIFQVLCIIFVSSLTSLIFYYLSSTKVLSLQARS